MTSEFVEVLAGHEISRSFTRVRRTDTVEVVAAIEIGDFAGARWLRCEYQIKLLDDAPASERAMRRKFIVTASALLDMGDQMTQVRTPGTYVHCCG